MDCWTIKEMDENGVLILLNTITQRVASQWMKEGRSSAAKRRLPFTATRSKLAASDTARSRRISRLRQPPSNSSRRVVRHSPSRRAASRTYLSSVTVQLILSHQPVLGPFSLVLPDCLSVSSRYTTDQFVLGVPLGLPKTSYVPPGSHVARVEERARKIPPRRGAHRGGGRGGRGAGRTQLKEQPAVQAANLTAPVT
ncbi:hypothetical protein E5676_scaffold261G00160 [Cucumis melo var. makuwa]|uniref:Uncharacterized protein n=1 Tax=Cucumis melo var. makuwa TaxID=1194695 RepID=A0A5D3BD84_CUCMM|nr:hypothetical protein E5676_scaffold261G00160 [Cucumis melo var. makuwa]